MDERRVAEGEARILVVEDDPALARLLKRVLTYHTAAVTTVCSGREALDAIAAYAFDAVATDISLPDMSGIELIARLREAAPAAGIVAITGFVDVDVAVQAMKAGADDFLGKPFNAEILWHVLDKAMIARQQRIDAERAKAYRRLAYTDALTGSPNRRFIDEFLDGALTAARSNGAPLTVAYLDIDNFKLLNDYLGHRYGDEVLRRVAEALGAHVTPPAQFARFGGDEFLAVFPGQAVVEIATIMEGVRAAVARIEVLSGTRRALPLRLSCGLAAFHGYEPARDLIAEAEDSMYLDKSLASGPSAGAALDAADPAFNLASMKALRSLVKAIDRRDSYTRFHSDHATQLAIALAQSLGFDDMDLRALTLGGPIHDLGKIVVPDDILRKPGPLTLEERRTMEEHPLMGAAITAAVTDIDTVVAIVRHHHEHFDGSGYPGGLARTEIPLATRLFSIADAFSAMTTDRPYRKSLTFEAAIAEIRHGAGTQFDPDLAVEFVRMLERDHRRRQAA